MLELKNVTKKYILKKNDDVVALNNISLKFNNSGMVFILGKSGSGKSTFLNVVGGLDSFDEGEIIINGKSSKGFSQSDFDSYRNSYIGFIFQEYNVIEDLNVYENIVIALELQGKKKDDALIDNVMKTLEIESLKDRKPKELSGGQKQRVAIARALIKNPEIIMADEPTGALDSATGKQVFDTLKEISKEKLVIVVSHDRDFAEEYADRIVEFKDGNIISDVLKKTGEIVESKKKIQYLKDDLVFIPKGYSLSEEDVKELIEKIKESNNDTFVALDKDALKKLSSEEVDMLTSDQFISFDSSSLDSNDGVTYKSIKSKLSLKNSFFFGLNSLKVKPFRLALVIVMACVSLGLFGFVDTLSSYSEVSTKTNTIADTKIDYASFTKKYSTYNWKTNVSYEKEYSDGYLGKQDIESLSKKFGIKFKGVYKNEDVGDFSLSGNLYRDYSDANPYYVNELSGLMEIDENDLKELNYNLAYGRLPTSSDEIAITDYTYHLFCEQGYYNHYKTSDRLSINEMDKYEKHMESSKLVDGHKTLFINNRLFTVTGIINTNFDFDKYEILIDNIDDSSYKYLSENYLLNIKYGYHNLGYLCEGSLDSIIQNNQLNLLNYITNYSVSCSSSKKTFSFKYVGKTSQIPSTAYLSSSVTNDGLKGNQIVVSDAYLFGEKGVKEVNNGGEYGGYPNWGSSSTIVSLWDGLLSTESNKIILDYEDSSFYNSSYSDLYKLYTNIDNAYLQIYAQDHIDEAHANGYSTYNSAEDYYKFLIDESPTSGDYGYHANPYGENGADLVKKEKQRLLKKYSGEIIGKSVATSIVDPSIYLDNQSKATFEIAGLFLADNGVSSHSMIVSDENYQKFVGVEEGYYSFVIGKMPKSKYKIRKLVSYEDKTKDVYFSLNNESKISVEVLNDTMNKVRNICLYVGLGFLFFSMLLIFNFISVSINNKRHDIGILRAIGSRANDIVKIFFTESLIIALVNFILSVSILSIAAAIVNVSIQGYTGLQVSLFSPGIRQIGIMLLLSLGVSYASCSIPVYLAARKKPINVIKDN